MNRTQTKKTEVLYYKHKLMRKTWPRGHGVVGSWCKQSCCSCSFIFIFKPGHIDCRHHHRIFHGRFGAISMATKRVTVLIPRLHWMSFLERWSVWRLIHEWGGCSEILEGANSGGWCCIAPWCLNIFMKWNGMSQCRYILFFPLGKNLVG